MGIGYHLEVTNLICNQVSIKSQNVDLVRLSDPLLECSLANPLQHFHCTLPYINIPSEPGRQAMAC